MKNLYFLIICVCFFSCQDIEKKSDNIKPVPNLVPTWAKKVVWYQVFPDRFCNGDTTNDPQLNDLEGTYPHDLKSEWGIHPWNSDWYELQSWEKKTGKDIWWNIQRRRYGGDLQGIINKIPYLKELGITAIYLNPVFWAPSLHKYDAICYHHIDPSFGPDPEGDKKIMSSEIPDDPNTWSWTSADLLALKLIEEAHKHGMKIIFDGVFNHMGLRSFAFQDVLKNQQNSKYKNWFTIHSWDDKTKGTVFNYDGWFGIKELPELKEDSMGIVAEPKKYIFDCTERWMQPEIDGKKVDGIDGWRLDVAFCIGHNFWKSWRSFVKSLNPQAYLTAEVIDSIPNVKPYLQGDEFDAIMNYNFAFTTSAFFINKKEKISVSEFDKQLKAIREAYPDDVCFVMQNLFDSHDTQRFTSSLVNCDIGKFSEWGNFFGISKAENLKYNPRKPNESEYKIIKLMVLFQMTYVGAPMVYYGDEVGMWGANDPCCRKPMLWNDIDYQEELYNQNGEKRTCADKVSPNFDLFNYYKKLISLRNKIPALQTGSFKTILIDDLNFIYAFERTLDSKTVLVVINNSPNIQKVNLPIPKNGYYNNLLTKAKINIINQTITIELDAYSGVILEKNE